MRFQPKVTCGFHITTCTKPLNHADFAHYDAILPFQIREQTRESNTNRLVHTLSTQDWFFPRRLERHLCGDTTVGANHFEQFNLFTGSPRTLDDSAIIAASRLIDESLCLEELLLLYGEQELAGTIATNEALVLLIL
jgi:hypothetical protein